MALVAGLRRSFPTFFLIERPIRWIGRSRRRTCVAAMLALLLVAGPPIWWETQLWGVPDIGEPFDAQAFRALTIPVERNAYVDYQEAWALFKPWSPPSQSAQNRVDGRDHWSVASAEIRRWAEDNRAALAAFRRGSERPDALDAVPKFEGTHVDTWGMQGPLRMLETLAMLEGSRLEAQGDMEGAWGWYRAVLRMIGHVGMHGTVHRRSVAQRWHDELRDRLSGWSADPRTTPDLVRRAIDDAVAAESLAPSETYTLKAEYQDVERLLEDPEVTEFLVGSCARVIAPTDFLPREQVMRLCDAWRTWLREPERSRRVMRLTFAHWIGYYELPASDRPRPDARSAVLPDFLYPLGPAAPANARVLSPRRLPAGSVPRSMQTSSWGAGDGKRCA